MSLIALLFLGALLPCGYADGTDSPSVVLVIRSGTLKDSEVRADPDLSPNLRWLVLHGTTLPEITLPAEIRGENPPPEVFREAIFDDELVSQLREQGISQVVLGSQSEQTGIAEANREVSSRGEPIERSRKLAELSRRFGTPPPLSNEERESVDRLRRLLDLDIPEVDLSALKWKNGESGEDAKTGFSLRRNLANQVASALEKGARIVALLDEAQAGEEEREFRFRDGLLGLLLEKVRGRARTTLAVLSIRGGRDNSRRLLALHGPRVRVGWVVRGEATMKDISAILLKIMEARISGLPSESSSAAERIYDILRE